MNEQRAVQFRTNSVRICIDSYDNEIVCGTICGVALAEEIPFGGMSDFVVKMDEAFNKIGRPQPTRVLRSFGEADSYQSYKGTPDCFFTSAEIGQKRGAFRTMDVVMTSRHRAEWQGIITEVNGHIEGRFQTILECMNLIGQILSDA